MRIALKMYSTLSRNANNEIEQLLSITMIGAFYLVKNYELLFEEYMLPMRIKLIGRLIDFLTLKSPEFSSHFHTRISRHFFPTLFRSHFKF